MNARYQLLGHHRENLIPQPSDHFDNRSLDAALAEYQAMCRHFDYRDQQKWVCPTTDVKAQLDALRTHRGWIAAPMATYQITAKQLQQYT